MTEQKTCYSTEIHPFISTALWLNSKNFLTSNVSTLSLVSGVSGGILFFANMHFQRDFQGLIYKNGAAITIE